jgi:beta-lactamase superfamily II metal-dependent hydrolase
VRFEVLAGAQCALRISAAAGASAVLANELSGAAQDELAAAGLATALLTVVPRHGYASGDSAPLRTALAARYAVLSQSVSGAQTRSVQQTTGAWETSGARVLVTGAAGAVSAEFGAAGLSLATERAGVICTWVSCAID